MRHTRDKSTARPVCWLLCTSATADLPRITTLSSPPSKMPKFQSDAPNPPPQFDVRGSPDSPELTLRLNLSGGPSAAGMSFGLSERSSSAKSSAAPAGSAPIPALYPPPKRSPAPSASPGRRGRGSAGAAGSGDTPAAFVCGGAVRGGAAPWAMMAVHVVSRAGRVFTVCPVCPGGMRLTAGDVSDMRQALLDMDDAPGVVPSEGKEWMQAVLRVDENGMAVADAREAGEGARPAVPVAYICFLSHPILFHLITFPLIPPRYPVSPAGRFVPAVQGPLEVSRSFAEQPDEAVSHARTDSALLLQHHMCLALVTSSAHAVVTHVLGGDCAPAFHSTPSRSSPPPRAPGTHFLMLMDVVSVVDAPMKQDAMGSAGEGPESDDDANVDMCAGEVWGSLLLPDAALSSRLYVLCSMGALR